MTATQVKWEHLRLNSGVGLRGWGKNVEEAFEEVGRSLTALFTAPELIQPSELFEFSCGASNDEELLLEFLNILIYSIRAKHMFFSHFEIQIKGCCLKARAWGQEMTISTERPLPTRSYRLPGQMLRDMRNQNDLRFAQCAVDM